MAIPVSRYIYCSKNGENIPLAGSIDVSTAEKNHLHKYNFGPVDQNYLKSLWPKPAYALTPLSSYRFAVIRILPRIPNEPVKADYNCFVVLIKARDWLEHFHCDIEPILFSKDLWNWAGETTLSPIDIQASPPLFGPDDQTRSCALSLLAHLEANRGNDNFKIFIDEKFADYQPFRWLNIILPAQQRETFSYCSRAVTDKLAFQVISLAKETVPPPANPDTVIWTPNLPKPGDTPYAQYIENLWQKGKLPPLAYIKKCINFENKLPQTQPESPASADDARQKILNYIAANPVKAPRQKRFTLPPVKNKNFITAIITIILISAAVYGGIWTRNKIYTYKLTAQGEEFLEKYPLTMVFEGQLPLEPILDQHKTLIQQIDSFSNAGKNRQLAAIKTKLTRWHQQAVAAENQQNQIDSIFRDMENVSLSSPPIVYPQPQKIQSIDQLDERLKKIQKNFVLPSTETMNLLQNKIKQIEKYNTSIEEILNDLIVKYKNFRQRFDQLDKPQYYSQPLTEDYQDFLDQIAAFRETSDLLNAINSPRRSDSLQAIEILDRLKTIQQELTEQLKAFNSYLVNAQNFIETFNLQYQICLSKPDSDLSTRLKQLKLLLNSTERFWPENDRLEELNNKYQNIEKLNKLNEYSAQIADLQQKISDSGQHSKQEIEKYQSKLDQIQRLADEIDSELDLITQNRDSIIDDIIAVQGTLEQIRQLSIETELTPDVNDLQTTGQDTNQIPADPNSQ